MKAFPIYAVAFALALPVLGQGSLTPPGAPAATMKSLSQIEPRMPISVIPTNLARSGSYYLVTNLTGIASSDGIIISVDYVTIDMAGCSLIGVAGSGRGIAASGARRNISIMNGTVRSWGLGGIDAGNAFGVTLTAIRSDSNPGGGIFGGDTSTITECTARENGNDGIRAGANSTLSVCASSGNSSNGIVVVNSCLATHCTASYNGLNGILANSRCRVSECVANFNTQSGISVITAGAVERCFTAGNGASGIISLSGGLTDILNNYTSENSRFSTNKGAGIRVGLDGSGGYRIEGNTLDQNYTGIEVLSTRNFIAANRAVASTGGTNYHIVGGNAVGPIVNVTGAAMAGVSNSVHHTANFEF